MEERREFDAKNNPLTGISNGETDEVRRLLSLHSLGILDSDPNPMLDGIVKAAAGLFHAPIALVSLVDEHRQWFKASIGLSGALEGVSETSRNIAFCDHTIAETKVMTVCEPTADPRFSANPLVTGEAGIRFYSGAPLRLPNGDRIGSLCVLDTAANSASAEQEVALQALAGVVVDFILAEADSIDTSSEETSRKSDPADVRDVILKVASTLMATEGSASFSVRKVAREAGISIGHLQHYFPDKHSLLKALLDNLAERFDHIYNDDIRAMPNPIDRLTVCAIAVLDEAENSAINQLMHEMWAISGRDEKLATSIQKIYAGLCKELGALIIEANPELDITEAELRAATGISLLSGSFLLTRLGLAEGYRDRTLEQIMSLPYSSATFV
ncbi:MAG: GAF domain-containing protein [Pseudomonadales bacterium]